MLTARQIPALPDGFYALGDCAGGYVRVRGTARVFNFKFQLAGRRREMTVGRFPQMTLAEARDAIRGLRAKVKSGVDPLTAEREAVVRPARAGTTFAACAKLYHDAHRSEWSDSHARWWWSAAQRQIFPALGDLNVADIDTGRVLACCNLCGA
jgi:hypothetical protein